MAGWMYKCSHFGRMYVYFFIIHWVCSWLGWWTILVLFVFYNKVSVLFFYKAVLLYKGKYETVKCEKKNPNSKE